MEQNTFKTLTGVGIPKLSFTLRHLVVKIQVHIKMLFIFSTPMLIGHLLQLQAAVFLHRCQMRALQVAKCQFKKML
jgi:hypothetical protein